MNQLLVDMAGPEPMTSQQGPVEDQRQQQLATWLWAAFGSEPLEDGMDHPAEEIIEQALHSNESQCVLEALRALSLDVAHPSFAASVLRCLGRQQNPGTDTWRTDLVRDGLAVDDVEIRDAAVYAAEWWGGREMRNVLQSHSEPKPWLRDYIRDVIEDLGE